MQFKVFPRRFLLYASDYGTYKGYTSMNISAYDNIWY